MKTLNLCKATLAVLVYGTWVNCGILVVQAVDEPETPPASGGQEDLDGDSSGDIWRFSDYFDISDSVFITPQTYHHENYYYYEEEEEGNGGGGGGTWKEQMNWYKKNGHWQKMRMKMSTKTKASYRKWAWGRSWQPDYNKNKGGGYWWKGMNKGYSGKMGNGGYFWKGKGGSESNSGKGMWGGGKMYQKGGNGGYWWGSDPYPMKGKGGKGTKKHMRYYGKWWMEAKGKKSVKSVKSAKSYGRDYKGKGKGKGKGIIDTVIPTQAPSASAAPSSAPSSSAAPSVSSMPTGFPSATPSRSPVSPFVFQDTETLITAVDLFLREPGLAVAEFGHIEEWDVSLLTDFANVFSTARNPLPTTTLFNEDISAWDTSNAVTMENMFRGSLFNRDISDWNVSNVQIFSGMFQGTANFNQDLSNWNVGSGTAFDRMFQGAISFASDISGWDLTNAGTTASMFEEALAFNVDLSNWSIGNVLDFSRMFRGAVTYDQDLCNWAFEVSLSSDFTDMFVFTNCEDTSDPEFVGGLAQSFCAICVSAPPTESSSPTVQPSVSSSPSVPPTFGPTQSPVVTESPTSGTDTPTLVPTTESPTLTPAPDWVFEEFYSGLDPDELFGTSVAISDDGEFFIGGAPGASLDFTDEGRIDLVEIESDTTTGAEGLAEGDNFGFAVSMASTPEFSAAFGRGREILEVFDANLDIRQEIELSEFSSDTTIFQISDDGSWIVVAGDEAVDGNPPGLRVRVYGLVEGTGGTSSYEQFWQSDIDSSFGDPGQYKVDITDDGANIVVTTVGNADIDQTGSFRVYQRNDAESEYVPLGSPVESTEEDDLFGQSVGITVTNSNDLIVAVGVAGSAKVIVYIFDGTTWNQYVEINPASDFDDQSLFGYDLSMDQFGSRIIIGAPCYTDDATPDTSCDGAIQVFDIAQDSAELVGSILAGMEASEFGTSVAMSADGNTFVAGAPKDCFGDDDCPGFVYLFVFDETPDDA